MGKGGDVDEITGGPQVILHPFTRTWPLLVNVNPSRSMLEGLLETGSPTITNDYKRLQLITIHYKPVVGKSQYHYNCSSATSGSPPPSFKPIPPFAYRLPCIDPGSTKLQSSNSCCLGT